MTFATRSALLTLVLVGTASPIAADGDQLSVGAQSDSRHRRARSCAAMAAGEYGFQCHRSTAPAGVLEPVTFIGTVTGTVEGVYEGTGTFNSSLGTHTVHVAGQATFGRNCFGHIDYTYELVLPGGETETLPPISFDFISVDDGNEILGTGVPNPVGTTGDLVPRITCRLVKTGR